MLKDEIYDFIDRTGAVSFVEIRNRFGSGEWWIETKENLYVGIALAEDVCKAIMELKDEKKILYYPTTPLVYIADGGLPTIPIAKKATAYKEEHWLPVVIYSTRSMKGKIDKKYRKYYTDAGYDV